MKISLKKIVMVLTVAGLVCASACSEKVKSSSGKNTKGEAKVEICKSLCDVNATDEAKKLYEFLRENYGKSVISGQMENAWNAQCNMLERVVFDTTKYPALLGFDYMNYTSPYGNEQETERAIKFWEGKNLSGKQISKNHGIVAFNWHWRAPVRINGKKTATSFRATETTFRIPYDTDKKQWKTDSDEYKDMMTDMDIIAKQLLRLQKKGVPVLWRPFHEGAGNLGGGWKGASAWFWWGSGNGSFTYKENGEEITTGLCNADICAECYIALWKLMYTYFTETKGIHNLIWVWNGQHPKFYPGSEYVDIIGDDIYGKPQDYSSKLSEFKKYTKVDPSKMIALTECSNIPSVQKMEADGAMWSFFMVWNDGDLSKGNGSVSKDTSDQNFWSGEYYNTQAHKEEIYQSKKVLTLDELPDFTKNKK